MTKMKISQSALNAIITVVKSIAPISESETELLVSLLQAKTVKKHEYLLTEGEVCRNVYFLVSVFFRMYYIDLEGSEINYRFVAENNFLVDFQSFLTQKPSHFYWQAMQDSEVLALPYQQIHHAYALSPA